MKDFNDSKSMINAGVGILLLIVIFIALKIYVFNGDLVNTVNTGSEEVKKVKNIKVNMEKLDTSVLKDARFKNLKDNEVQKPDIEDLKVGKDNPFVKSE